jgi:hypothetical protein
MNFILQREARGMVVTLRQWQQATEATKEKVLTTSEISSPVVAKTSFERAARRLLRKVGPATLRCMWI